ncbi:STAS domain-containing protein [Amycolatopsis sp. cmx-4-68]|uniref:STAS domain-containing protein n=1 Tax=Amycolatopsis sp. cmx-4-68 TaxID=2790938 RepID=UPI003979CA6B
MTEDLTSLLTVQVSTVPEAAVVAAAGDLDLGTASVLRAQAVAVLAGRPDALIVDLGGIAFCGSAGLQVLAELAETTGAAGMAFAVVADRYPVLRPVALSGMAATLTVHGTVDGARGWIREQAAR